MAVFTLVNPPNGSGGDRDALTMLLSRVELARRQAGQPTYRKISSRCALSASTICRFFNATKPPSWDNLTEVLRALGVDAEDDSPWHELWLAAVNDAKPIPVELGDGMIVPGRQNCSSCGAWIADNTAHTEHHTRIDRLADAVDQLQLEIAMLDPTRSQPQIR